ncbi:hypothetical protein [Tolypothrix sp. VBCCA 56010]|uniref:hypothetical protein n=1 Tax=Tolypothrix sp. VBCCA 56010 TaxID=3137731 RepID=UPI003D7CB782
MIVPFKANGEWGQGRQGDKGDKGDKETRRQGDKGTRRQGEFFHNTPLVSPSPPLLIPPSPCLPLSLSPYSFRGMRNG